MNVEYTGRQTTITTKLKLQARRELARIAKIVGSLRQRARDSDRGQVPADRRSDGADRHQKRVARARRPKWGSPCAMRW